MAKKCPPGFLCMSNNILVSLLVFAMILIGTLTYYNTLRMHQVSSVSSAPASASASASAPPSTTVVYPPPIAETRYDRAPQPLRDWMMPPEIPPRGGIATIPINIPTQGLPETFQTVGIITTSGQGTGGSEKDVLPLFGRRTAGSSDRWNYYTRTNTFNPVPIPVRYQRRDCMDDIGCNELLSGDDIHIDAVNQRGKVRMYRFDGPKYIPGLL